jgi:non-heme chloroperoxidase
MTLDPRAQADIRLTQTARKVLPDAGQHHVSSSSTDRTGVTAMDRVKTEDGTEIFFKDWGNGQPLFFHHGWPLSADDWDAQMMFFLGKGYRVVAHDRRGHGR